MSRGDRVEARGVGQERGYSSASRGDSARTTRSGRTITLRSTAFCKPPRNIRHRQAGPWLSISLLDMSHSRPGSGQAYWPVSSSSVERIILAGDIDAGNTIVLPDAPDSVLVKQVREGQGVSVQRSCQYWRLAGEPLGHRNRNWPRRLPSCLVRYSANTSAAVAFQPGAERVS
jgi:hypothetical protein